MTPAEILALVELVGRLAPGIIAAVGRLGGIWSQEEINVILAAARGEALSIQRTAELEIARARAMEASPGTSDLLQLIRALLQHPEVAALLAAQRAHP